MSNPNSRLDSKAFPTISGASCLNTTPLNATGPILPTGTLKAYCASVTVSSTSAVTFTPGTYVFQNASLTIGGIASFACAGCTFVFIGSTPGKLSISNTSAVTISAPTVNASDADYDGILFYRAGPVATGSSAAPTLNLQRVSAFNLTGSIYRRRGARGHQRPDPALRHPGEPAGARRRDFPPGQPRPRLQLAGPGE